MSAVYISIMLDDLCNKVLRLRYKSIMNDLLWCNIMLLIIQLNLVIEIYEW